MNNGTSLLYPSQSKKPIENKQSFYTLSLGNHDRSSTDKKGKVSEFFMEQKKTLKNVLSK